jgi:hypothetical protein
VLHSRTHRVPDERDADLGVLRTGLCPTSVEECQYLYEIAPLEEKQYPDPSTKGPEEQEGRQDDMQEEGTGQVDGREGALKLLLGRICCWWVCC